VAVAQPAAASPSLSLAARLLLRVSDPIPFEKPPSLTILVVLQQRAQERFA
jgi:hypothetical protein